MKIRADAACVSPSQTLMNNELCLLQRVHIHTRKNVNAIYLVETSISHEANDLLSVYTISKS